MVNPHQSFSYQSEMTESTPDAYKAYINLQSADRKIRKYTAETTDERILKKY